MTPILDYPEFPDWQVAPQIAERPCKSLDELTAKLYPGLVALTSEAGELAGQMRESVRREQDIERKRNGIKP